MNYKSYNNAERRQLLSDIAGDSSWYEGDYTADSTIM